MLSLFSKTIWNSQTYREITEIIKRENPDIVHCHNTFPIISPSVYWAAAKQGVPVVQTLHNYRLVCINPYLYRNGKICEDCLGHAPIPGILHRCYRGSLAASFTVAAMLMIHRRLGTYRNKVTTYIALTEFGRKKFLEARLCDPTRVVVKPNAVAAEAATAPVVSSEWSVECSSGWGSAPDPASESPSHTESQQRHREDQQSQNSSQTSCQSCNPVQEFASLDSCPLLSIHGSSPPATVLYVGRLSPEKGVDILIAAWKLFLGQLTTASEQKKKKSLGPEALPRLHIIGDGPERDALETAAADTPSIAFLGRLPHDQIASHMRSANALVLPSRCYEMFAITPLEAMQIGLPVILSESAAMGSLVEDGATGYTFESGSAKSLAETLAKAMADPARLAGMGRLAQTRFLASDCPPERNVATLCQVYARVCPPNRRAQANPPPPSCGH